jgi:hypothetical protein
MNVINGVGHGRINFCQYDKSREMEQNVLWSKNLTIATLRKFVCWVEMPEEHDNS